MLRARFPHLLSTALTLGAVALTAQSACSDKEGPSEQTGGAGNASGGGSSTGSGGTVNYGGAGGEGSVGLECGAVPDTSGDFSKKALLGASAACASHFTCEFFNAATTLGREVTAYTQDPSEAKLERARTAWLGAMDAWAMTIPFEYGPIVGVGTDKYHGRGVGAYVHPWPSPNLCEVSKQLVTRFYEENGLTRVPPGARGLFALEAILFSDFVETGCPASSTTATAWAELSDADKLKAKLDYAKVIADDVYRRAEELVGVWSPDGENFTQTLVNADGYGTEQEALTVVSWSLLYVYTEIRDTKIAPLAGVVASQPNPETPFARVDREAILTNLRAFRALFQGCDGGTGLGFDDWLASENHAELRDDILAALERVEEAAAELPPLHQATQEQMLAFYDDLKVLTDLLKGELLGSASPLNLKLPASAASDTD